MKTTAINILKTLKECGLSEKQAKVYLAGIKLGTSSVQKLSKESELKRTTTYSILDSLEDIGLVRVDVQSFKKKYIFESPEKIENILEKRKEEYKKLLPELLAKYGLDSEESTVKYYTGNTAVKSVYESLIKEIKKDEEYLIIGNVDAFLDQDRDFYEDF